MKMQPTAEWLLSMARDIEDADGVATVMKRGDSSVKKIKPEFYGDMIISTPLTATDLIWALRRAADGQTAPSLDATIKHWHRAEMEVSALKDALTRVLRMQTGVSPQAKAVLRAALHLSHEQTAGSAEL
jgi:hypothetical protein